MAILPVIVLVPAVVILIVALAVVRRGGGMANAMLTEPRCAKCNYDLRGFTGSVPQRCSECGADLTAPRSIAWGTFQPKNRRVMIVAALVVMAPAILIPLLLTHVGGTMRATTAMFPGSPAFLARPNAVVIASLSTSANQPWDWQELERRLDAGKLSSAEVSAAIDKLIAFLNTQSTPQPLYWCDSFLKKADAAGYINSSQYQRFAQAFYKRCTASLAGSIRAGKTVAISVNGGSPWPLPGVQYVYALRDVSTNGKGLALEHQGYRGQSRAGIQSELDYLSAVSPQQITGKMKLDLPPGNYVLNVTVDVAVLHDKTAPQLGGNFPGQAGGWPLGRASWTDVLTVPIKVVPADQSPIDLITDPTLDPLKLGEIHVKSILVTRSGSGRHVAVNLGIDVGRMPCSFDAFLRIGGPAGKEYPMGQAVGYFESIADVEHGCDLDSLDASVQTADVLLRPNPKHIEGTPGVSRVWDSSVEVLNVPMQRFDLPGK